MELLRKLFWLFTAYSFLGWILETVFQAIARKKFVNRGFLNGPLCTIYGFAAVAMTVVLHDLAGNWVFLFLGSAVIATVIEWFSGMALEHFGVGRWWDYSRHKWNLGGYISFFSSAVWGLLGLVALAWINPLLLSLYQMVPDWICGIVQLVSLGIIVLDFVGSAAAINLVKQNLRIQELNDRIEEATQEFGRSIAHRVARRMTNAHPKAITRKKETPTVFAQGCGFHKLFMLMVLGAFLGDIVETIFVRITGGVWMSRSSLVWGQFSLVWGLALAAATALLYRYRHRSDSFLFVFGVVLGGAYEYACSVFTEVAFGTVFWDYSHIPFNLGGRINLLYCFFWGIAAVIWLKKVYPIMAKWIERIPMQVGRVLVAILAVFLAIDVVVTCGAMARYTQRTNGVEASGVVAQWLDETFDDTWMEQRYQNMQLTKP